MKQYVLVAATGLALAGCVSPYGWSEAPLDDRYYAGGGAVPNGAGPNGAVPNGAAPVDWWGRDAASVDLFYGALSGYGSWATHSRYGRIFLPGNVGPGWQPYSRGYWRNDQRYGRMWQSSEPWGWATYHYGRWGNDSRYGWFWVPDTRFGPGWVDWRDSGGYASWAPIPPMGWSSWGYGYGNNWWVNAPGAWAYRPDMYRYMRPGRHDWRDGHNGGMGGRPHQPVHVPNGGHPRSHVDAPVGDVINNYRRGQAALGRPPGSGWVAPSGQGAHAPRVGHSAPTGAAPQPRAEMPRSAPAPRGYPGSAGRHSGGRDVSPRTHEQ